MRLFANFPGGAGLSQTFHGVQYPHPVPQGQHHSVQPTVHYLLQRILITRHLVHFFSFSAKWMNLVISIQVVRPYIIMVYIAEHGFLFRFLWLISTKRLQQIFLIKYKNTKLLLHVSRQNLFTHFFPFSIF